MTPEPDDTLRAIFGDPIDVYTDAQALDDGALVDIAPWDLSFRGRLINRVTGGLFAALEQSVKQPGALKGVLRAKLRHGTLRGGIWQVPPGLWLIANEVGGWTLMRPEDY